MFSLKNTVQGKNIPIIPLIIGSIHTNSPLLLCIAGWCICRFTGDHRRERCCPSKWKDSPEEFHFNHKWW